MIRVRDALLSDADSLTLGNTHMAIETESVTLTPHTIAAGVKAVLTDPAKGRYWIAETKPDDAAPWTFAGMIMITHEWSDWRNGDLWWIQSVYVPPPHRRQGVFRALYNHVRHLAQKQNAVGLRLYVEQNNAAGQSTYHNLGMQKTHYHIMEEIFKSIPLT